MDTAKGLNSHILCGSFPIKCDLQQMHTFSQDSDFLVLKYIFWGNIMLAHGTFTSTSKRNQLYSNSILLCRDNEFNPGDTSNGLEAAGKKPQQTPADEQWDLCSLNFRVYTSLRLVAIRHLIFHGKIKDSNCCYLQH
jgi:hypothetical protein